MGSTFTVQYWTNEHEGEYKYYVWWSGESLDEAMKEMVKCKDKNYGCVKLEWRG
jgi:hypothetical protein